jgi:hypothetical protein
MYDQYADSPRERHRRSLAHAATGPLSLIECLTLHCGAPRARGAWPLAWPSPSGPAGLAEVSSAQGWVLKIVSAKRV